LPPSLDLALRGKKEAIEGIVSRKFAILLLVLLEIRHEHNYILKNVLNKKM
jgi:hypothetical protein